MSIQSYLYFKRVLDVVFSTLALLACIPLMLIVAIAIKFDSPNGPIVYKGVRASKNSGFFYMFKFRTMEHDAELKKDLSTALNDPRLTSIGGFLRKYKIDELPQFINIIKGDMSIVGPRPQVTYYTDQYSEEENLILSVRPGVTDLASLVFIDMDSTLGSENVDEKYQNEIEPIKNKLRLRYVRSMSFKTDTLILIGTLLKLFRIKSKKIEDYLQCDLSKYKHNQSINS